MRTRCDTANQRPVLAPALGPFLIAPDGRLLGIASKCHFPSKGGLCGISLCRIRTCFRNLDNGSGLLFSVTSQDKSVHFGASVYLRSPGTVAGLSLWSAVETIAAAERLAKSNNDEPRE